MKLFFPEELERYALRHTSPEPELLGELQRETAEKVPMSQMLTGRVEGTFLKLLVKISGARRAVDIGTYTGFSALMIAEALPPGGEVVTLEKDISHAEFALRYFERSPHREKIRLVQGPALDSLRDIKSGTVEFVFIDADKANYANYYEEGFRILHSGGLIAVDNVFWSGEVLAPSDDNGRAIARFNDLVAGDDRVEKVMLSIRDGVYLIRKN